MNVKRRFRKTSLFFTLFTFCFTLLAVIPDRIYSTGWGENPGMVEKSRKHGGVLTIGTRKISTFDPHFATSIPDIQLLEQVYEHLTCLGSSNQPLPDLAIRWESPDGKKWTFTLRENAHFSNGRPVTAEDVVYSFVRLRIPNLKAPSLNLFRNIRDVWAQSRKEVVFVLWEANAEFPADVADYHAAIIPSGTLDPAAERIGSGPFMFDKYLPNEKIILKPNPYYDGKGDDGETLPYLDELHLVFSPSQYEHIAAFQRGEVDFLGGLTAATARMLQDSGDADIVSVDANMHWVIRMRSDPGRPAADNRVRQALKLATNHQALVNAIRPGLASMGNGFTPVGPAFGMYYLVQPPFRDTSRARRLLAEAGYPRGLDITLDVQNHPDAVAIAELWKQQMAVIAVDVELNIIPPEVYYGNGVHSWLSTDFGITEWGDRVSPAMYFKLAYTSDAPWNETHWADPEFDRIVQQIDQEIDDTQRRQLYHRAQKVLIDRGPVIVAFFARATAAGSPGVRGVRLASDWPRTRFRNVWLDR